MALELVPLGILKIVVDHQIRMGPGPHGERIVGTASRYRLDGERIHAHESASPATDWLLLGSNGVGTVDARMLFETHDGALIGMRYSGRLRPTTDGATVVTTPTFETDDIRYSWLNEIQAVGQGERKGTELVYELYIVQSKV